MNVEVQSPSQLDPFFQEGGEPSHDPTWITVFGFTSSATAFILKVKLETQFHTLKQFFKKSNFDNTELYYNM